MTFNTFKKIVLKHFPKYIITHHGFNGNKNIVAVQFKENGKIYRYTGSYFEIAVKLKLPVISKKIYDDQKNQLQFYIDNNGMEDDFGYKNDYTLEIEKYKKWLLNAEKYEII